jgi:hypothetical protein
MLHFTCDLCGKELRPGEDDRFVVKIEAFAAHDPAELTEEDLDEDHMEAISQLLRDDGEDIEVAAARKNFRYDLCPECHAKFLRDPLGRDGVQKFDFSKN